MKNIYMRVIAIALCIITVFGIVAMILKQKDRDIPDNVTHVGSGREDESDIKADSIMITMNEGFSATADEFFYHALGLRNEYIYQYGEEIFAYDPDLSEDILHEVDSILIDNAAYTLWGHEVGFELTESDLAAFEEQVEQLKEYLIDTGSTFEKHLKANNLTEELFRKVYLTNMYVNKFVSDYLISDMPNIEVTDEEVSKYLEEYTVLAAKHILIDDTSAPTYEEQLTIAESILARIDKGEDFDSLMQEFSKDPGLESKPDGYTFRKGEFVPEFESVTIELEIGEISGIVESNYGLHIIQRIELDLEEVKNFVRQRKLEEKRLSYEQRLDPQTTELRNGLILLEMKSVI